MYIGIDLGGTNTAGAIVDGSGVIIKRAGRPTDTSGGEKTVVEGIVRVCEELLDENHNYEVEGHYDLQPHNYAMHCIGIGIPGTVDGDSGAVVFTPNLPLSGVNLARELKKQYACPIFLGNDANCAALGEVVAGGAKGVKDAVLITLGTGVGGGVILGGKIHTGLSGAAGELGHMVISTGGRACGCGRRGCWESYASASGLIRTAKEYMRLHKESSLWELCGGYHEKVDGRLIFKAYRDGDRVAEQVVERYVRSLAAGIVNIINMLEPELICVGGGISNEWDSFADKLQSIIDREKYTRFSPQSASHTRIVRAELGNDAGIIGAAALGYM